MNFLELSKKRYSVRDFKSKAVEQEKINYILECARLAPSAVNFQPWMIFVVKNTETLAAIQESYNRDWFKTAPMCIVVAGNHEQSWKRKPDNKDHCDIDASIITEHIVIAATEQGLGTCWVCNFDKDLCKKALEITDESIEPIAIIPIGYAKDENAASEKKRKNIDEIVKFI